MSVRFRVRVRGICNKDLVQRPMMHDIHRLGLGLGLGLEAKARVRARARVRTRARDRDRVTSATDPSSPCLPPYPALQPCTLAVSFSPTLTLLA